MNSVPLSPMRRSISNNLKAVCGKDFGIGSQRQALLRAMTDTCATALSTPKKKEDAIKGYIDYFCKPENANKVTYISSQALKNAFATMRE